MLGRPSFNRRSTLPGEYATENTGLLEDIESLSRALSLPHPFIPKPKANTSSSSQKKPSFWNWKPLKALSHIRQRRFDCVFYLHVHSIKNLSAAFGDAALSVHWRRTSDPPSFASVTNSVHAFDGIAEFDETLTYRCSVYGTRKSSSHSAAKYEARHFVINVLASNAPELDLGKHLVDVTRLLPLTMEELEDTGNSSRTWSTSFRLSGPAKGASLNVSFGFSLMGDCSLGSSNGRKVVDAMNLKFPDEGSIGKTSNKSRRWARSQSVEDVRVLHEVLPSSKSAAFSLVDSVEKLKIANCEVNEFYDLEVDSNTKPNEFCNRNSVVKPKLRALIDHFEGSYSEELEEPEFAIIEQDLDMSAKNQQSALIFEKIDLEVADQGIKVISKEVEEICDANCDCKENSKLHENIPTAFEVQDFALNILAVNKPNGCVASHFESIAQNQIHNVEERAQNKTFCFADTTETVASNFLLGADQSPRALSSDADPESPRERLWKQFEEETLGAGSLLFSLANETEIEDKPCEDDNLLDESEDFDLLHLVHEAERELPKFIEDAEAEVLMRQWGLNEKSFHCSPPANNNGFGNRIGLPSEMASDFSPLAEGLGPFVQTKDGGFLRSMSPSLFSNSKSNASLIMQVSNPVVVPAEMGSDVMEILHCLASVGIEKLSMQAETLMPLEDVSGKTMQQIALETIASVDACEREADTKISQNISYTKNEGILNSASPSTYDRDSKYVSVEDLAPLAMARIEPLCIEGLRIQSGISDEEPPSTISSHLTGNMPSLEEETSINGGVLNVEGPAGLPLLDVKQNSDDVDRLMSLAITLEEWLRIDSGILDDEDQNSDRASKILAAYCASSPMLRGKRSSRRWGLLGDYFTAALMVQLRDPLRDYSPVGIPMLALVQVERVFLSPNPNIYTTVSEKGSCEEDDELEPELDTKLDKKKEEEGIPQFKITKVHVAGLRTDTNERKIWGNPMQKQSGSRWLIANGMGKSNKHPFLKSKASPVIASDERGDALWSISSHFHGASSKWKEMFAVNHHFRNPNVNFRKEAMNL